MKDLAAYLDDLDLENLDCLFNSASDYQRTRIIYEMLKRILVCTDRKG